MRVSPTIVLRNAVEADLPTFFEFQREPEANAMVGIPPRDEPDFYQHWRERILGNPEVNMKAIEWDGHLVGHVASFNRDGRRLVGYWLGKTFWGKGIATAAVKEFLSRHENTRPLTAFVAVKNRGSYRVLTKCGFVQASQAIRASDGVDEFRMELYPS